MVWRSHWGTPPSHWGTWRNHRGTPPSHWGTWRSHRKTFFSHSKTLSSHSKTLCSHWKRSPHKKSLSFPELLFFPPKEFLWEKSLSFGRVPIAIGIIGVRQPNAHHHLEQELAPLVLAELW